jgi:hypothetical protein
MNINDSFPSAYLKASDLGTAQPVVTIERVEHEPVGREKELKAILYFVGKEKGVVLNKTNSKKIVELIGSPETDDWSGFKIRLFATTTEFGGETVECIRVKAAGVPTKPKPAPAPVRRSASVAVAVEDVPEVPIELTDDEIPF